MKYKGKKVYEFEGKKVYKEPSPFLCGGCVFLGMIPPKEACKSQECLPEWNNGTDMVFKEVQKEK